MSFSSNQPQQSTAVPYFSLSVDGKISFSLKTVMSCLIKIYNILVCFFWMHSWLVTECHGCHRETISASFGELEKESALVLVIFNVYYLSFTWTAATAWAARGMCCFESLEIWLEFPQKAAAKKDRHGRHSLPLIGLSHSKRNPFSNCLVEFLQYLKATGRAFPVESDS